MRLNAEYYPTVFLTAVVATVFSVVVCALLVVDFARRSNDLAIDIPEYQALKAKLTEEPDNTTLRDEIRTIDQQMREEYFRQRRFAYRGACLLVGGVLIALFAARLASTLRRKLPRPSGEPSRIDPDTKTLQFAFPAVAVLVLLLVGATVALSVGFHSSLPGSLDELSVMLKSENGSVSDDLALPTPEKIAQSWPRFRGPLGDGVSAYDNLPTNWNAASGEGILWKSPVPLPGNNSPVVWGDRVFLTGATEDRREVYCFDGQSGRLLWSKNIPAVPPGGPPPKISEDTGYAAPTVTTDGRRVYAMFANGDVTALDCNGNITWSKALGTPKNIYGHAASLALYRGLLIVQFDQGSKRDGLSQLLALHTATGEVAWKTARDVPNSWSSPIVIEHGGQPRIITCADPWVVAYDAEDGVEVWRAKCLRADVGPSPVFADGVVYTVNEFPHLSAIRVGGKGDVTESHVAWTADVGLPDTAGPIVTDEFVILLASYGTLTCYDKAEGGEPLWEMDFDDNFQSSPGLVGNLVYLIGEEGKAWIVEISREAGKQIAESDLGEPCVTSPAFQDGRIYIRGGEHLFCIGTE